MPDTNKTIKQSRFGVQLVFEFAEDKLVFTHRDKSGETSFSTLYDTIVIQDPSYVTVNKAQRLGLVIGFTLLVVAGGLDHAGISHSETILVGLAFLMAIAFYFINRVYNILSIKYTSLNCVRRDGTPAKIWIIHDRKCKIILQEIEARWKNQLRKELGTINYENDPERELKKFAWLKKNQVISEQEYEEIVGKIQVWKNSLHNQPESSKPIIN